MYQIYDFSTFSNWNELIYIQKSQNKQIFGDPCKIRKQKLKTVWIFLQGPVQKRLKIESQFFAAMLFGPKTSKKYVMFTLIKNSNFYDINPPTPETFFASDFDDFCKYGSHATLEKGKGRK